MAKVKKTWRPRAVYEQLLAEREREGLTFPELSERSGVPPSTLQEWARRLREERGTQEKAFVEVVPASEPMASHPVRVLLRSGHTLLLEAGPPSEGLADLVKLLEAC